MKLKQLITGGALAATVLTLGSAQAETNYHGIVFCKARIMSSGGDPSEMFSITLPFTTTDSEGQYTYWNLGVVPPGGVADSWHSKGGPGRFVAHNDGEVDAFVYLTSTATGSYRTFKEPNGLHVQQKLDIISSGQPRMAAFPSPSLQQWRTTTGRYYCLAFTRDVMDKVPTWHMLNMFTQLDNLSRDWRLGEDVQADVNYIGAYMGHLDAGDYMPFDVKLWAPRWNGDRIDMNLAFTFMVEASPFPLWEHDVDVQ